MKSKPQSAVEWMILESLCTNNETYFFRESKALEWLADRLADPDAPKGPTRVWSAGCSTGEEAYTLSILLSLREGFNFQIVGSDIDVNAIRSAHSAKYRSRRVSKVPKEVKSQFFRTVDGLHHLNTDLLTEVSFYRCNLLNQKFSQSMGPFHAIVCRNVLIYLSPTAQQTLIDIFYNALVAGGVLLLGSCESLVTLESRFTHNFENDISYYQREES